jgi:hypothetical protein
VSWAGRIVRPNPRMDNGLTSAETSPTTMPTNMLRRRLVSAALSLPVLPLSWLPVSVLPVVLLQGCAAPLPKRSNRTTAAAAESILEKSAAAHGIDALSTLTDINVGYAGKWRAFMNKLQPALVDAGYRGASEERILLRERLVAQALTGPSGRKHVVRRSLPGEQGSARVWRNGEESHDGEQLAAAALVVDGYSLFLLGPMLLAQHWRAERALTMELGGVEHLTLDHRQYECDVLRIGMKPGLGFSESDELALFIDREEHLMRRVRFSLDGLESTRGAIAEVEADEHVTLHGIRWPTRFYERLLRPLPLPVHNWHLTGLDVNRGLTLGEVDGPEFSGRAAAPAAKVDLGD